MTTFKLEMSIGQDQRIVEADNFYSDNETGWMIFYRNDVEYWRVRLDRVVSMETMS